MTPVLAFLRRVPMEVWLVLIAVAFFAVALGWAYGEGRLSRAAEVRQLQTQVLDLESANASAQQVIAQLSRINRELAEGRAADQKAAAEAVAELRRHRDALAKELERRRTDRGVIYERDPSAGAWASARVPDAVARSLRD